MALLASILQDLNSFAAGSSHPRLEPSPPRIWDQPMLMELSPCARRRLTLGSFPAFPMTCYPFPLVYPASKPTAPEQNHGECITPSPSLQEVLSHLGFLPSHATGSHSPNPAASELFCSSPAIRALTLIALCPFALHTLFLLWTNYSFLKSSFSPGTPGLQPFHLFKDFAAVVTSLLPDICKA